MKKLIILLVALVLCCCVLSLAGAFLFGNFEANGQCLYKGPMATVNSGACAGSASTTVNTVDRTANSTNSTTGTTSQTRTYNGASYSLNYPDTFSIDDSDSTRLFVYASNGLDNLNISKKILAITTTQSDCEDYASQTITDLTDYSAELVDVSTTTINGYGACKVYFTADYGTESGKVSQTQYYIAVGSQTYFETITINQDSTLYTDLDTIAKSIQFN